MSDMIDRLPADGLNPFGGSMTSILGVAFALSSISILGIGSFSLEGITLTTALFTWNGLAISYGAVIGVASVALGYALNDADIEEFTDTQSWVAYATALSVILLALSPALTNAITSSQIVAWIVFLLQLTGFGLIAGLRGDY